MEERGTNHQSCWWKTCNTCLAPSCDFGILWDTTMKFTVITCTKATPSDQTNQASHGTQIPSNLGFQSSSSLTTTSKNLSGIQHLDSLYEGCAVLPNTKKDKSVISLNFCFWTVQNLNRECSQLLKEIFWGCTREGMKGRKPGEKRSGFYFTPVSQLKEKKKSHNHKIVENLRPQYTPVSCTRSSTSRRGWGWFLYSSWASRNS